MPDKKIVQPELGRHRDPRRYRPDYNIMWLANSVREMFRVLITASLATKGC